MEKLELRYLAPYLPYSLEMMRVENNRKINTSELTPTFLHEQRWDVIWKPILRPLSDLAEYLHKYKNEEYPILIDEGSIFLTDSCELNMLEITSNYKFYEFLFKNHFDLFGLIGKGLAIDINEINGRL